MRGTIITDINHWTRISTTRQLLELICNGSKHAGIDNCLKLSRYIRQRRYYMLKFKSWCCV